MASQRLLTDEHANDDLRLLTIPETARLLNCSRRHVYDVINRGDLPTVDIGRKRVSEEDLRRYIDRHRVVAAEVAS